MDGAKKKLGHNIHVASFIYKLNFTVRMNVLIYKEIDINCNKHVQQHILQIQIHSSTQSCKHKIDQHTQTYEQSNHTSIYFI